MDQRLEVRILKCTLVMTRCVVEDAPIAVGLCPGDRHPVERLGVRSSEHSNSFLVVFEFVRVINERENVESARDRVITTDDLRRSRMSG